MSDSSKSRAVFHQSKQKAFLTEIQSKIGIAYMSKICKCSERTIRDWRREKYWMTVEAVGLLADAAKIKVPTDFTVRDRYDHTSAAGKKGGRSLIDTYGRIQVDEKYRRKKWLEWWDTTGKSLDQKILQPKSITIPPMGQKLAEFIGIMIGDGGISHAQVTISLNHIDDLAYTSFVLELIEELFSVRPALYHLPKKSINNITVSRVELVRYVTTLGLPVGNKIAHAIDIPEWIKSDRDLSIACVRGLIDTDGCIFTHSYVSKGKKYFYKKIDFTSASEPLRRSVYNIFKSFDMSPRLTKHKNVRLESSKDVRKYFEVFGSHNPKHLNRYVS